MASIVEEKGTLLFSRYASVSTCYNLEKNVFPSLSPQDVVEIYGESGSGKTELLYHFIAQCILPQTWKGLNLPGLELKVIFIDNDCHFNLFRLITILETRLKSLQKKCSIKISSEEIAAFIKERIKLLEIIKCYDSEQFFLTLCSLENMLSLNSAKTVMMIDGMTSFYWCDKMRTQNQEKNLLILYSQIASMIKKISQHYKIPIFATRRKMIKSLNIDKKVLGQTWKSVITWNIELNFVCSKPDRTLLSLLNVTKNVALQCGIGKFGFIFMGKIANDGSR